MAYNVKNSAGQTVTIVPDRHIDRDATSLALIGYNVTNYGLDHAENFIHLLENFSSDTAPDAPMVGQLWFDSANQALKIWAGGTWKPVGGSGGQSVGGDPFENGLAGVYHLALTSPATSILLFFAAGKIVMIVSTVDFAQSALPASVVIADIEYPLSSRFPFGCEAGVTLAEDSEDYFFNGRVAQSQQALFAGGGDANKPAGWTFADLGTNSVSMMLANGQFISAISQVAIPNGDLPVTVAVNVRLDDHTVQTTSIPFRSVFPSGLLAGLTYATGFGGFQGGGDGTVTLSLLAGELAASYAQITDEYTVYVDSTSAVAQKMLLLETKFLAASGDVSFSQAIDTILSQSSDTAAVTIAITALKAEFQTALGTTSFAEALTKLSTTATATTANSESLTQLQSAFTTATGETTFASAIDRLWTEANADGPALSGWSLTLNSGGYVTGVEALNGGATNNFFKVTTSNFIIGDNNIDFIPFQVKDGVVYIKNAVIENLTISGNKLQPFAIGQTARYEWVGFGSNSIPTSSSGLSMGSLCGSAGNWVSILPGGAPISVAFTSIPNGSRVILNFSLCGRQSGDNDDPYKWRIIRDDGYVLPTNPFMALTSRSATAQSWTFVDDSLGDGSSIVNYSHTYTVQALRISSGQDGRLLQVSLLGNLGKK